MVISMMVNGMKIKDMEEENVLLLMEMNMMVNGTMIK